MVAENKEQIVCPLICRRTCRMGELMSIFSVSLDTRSADTVSYCTHDVRHRVTICIIWSLCSTEVRNARRELKGEQKRREEYLAAIILVAREDDKDFFRGAYDSSCTAQKSVVCIIIKKLLQ
jgi:hypothetical protein